MKIKKTKFVSAILFLIILLQPNIKGQEKLGQTGLQFLDIGVSPRAEAMGGAFVIAGNNADAIFYNPAGIAKVNTDFDIVINRVQWFADIGYNAIGLTYRPPSGNYGVFGLSFQNTDYGDFYGTRVVEGSVAGYEDTGIFTPSAFAIGIAYSNQLTDKFSIGGQAKFVKQNLGDNIISIGQSAKKNTVSGFAFDFGMIYSTGIKGFDFGMSIKNFASDFKYEEFSFEAPLTFRIGLALNVTELLNITDNDQNFIIVADAVHPRDFTEHLDLGGEYTLYNIISFRAGYKVNYSEQDFTAGVGLKYNVADVDLRINYAYGAFGLWNSVHRFSLGFSL